MNTKKIALASCLILSAFTAHGMKDKRRLPLPSSSTAFHGPSILDNLNNETNSISPEAPTPLTGKKRGRPSNNTDAENQGMSPQVTSTTSNGRQPSMTLEQMAAFFVAAKAERDKQEKSEQAKNIMLAADLIAYNAHIHAVTYCNKDYYKHFTATHNPSELRTRTAQKSFNTSDLPYTNEGYGNNNIPYSSNLCADGQR